MRYSFLMILAAGSPLLGCGDSGMDGTGGGGAPARSVAMDGEIGVTGDQDVSGSFVRAASTQQESCAKYAAEGSVEQDTLVPGTFAIPGPYFGTPLEPTGDLYSATLNIPAVNFEGPGTYVNHIGEPPQIRGQMVVGDIDEGARYYVDEGTATAVVEADGSGTLTFEDIPEDAGGETQISGSVTWSCTD